MSKLLGTNSLSFGEGWGEVKLQKCIYKEDHESSVNHRPLEVWLRKQL